MNQRFPYSGAGIGARTIVEGTILRTGSTGDPSSGSRFHISPFRLDYFFLPEENFRPMRNQLTTMRVQYAGDLERLDARCFGRDRLDITYNM
jgi:hypothetical protein